MPRRHFEHLTFGILQLLPCTGFHGDVIGISEGSLFDATQTKVTPLGEKSLVKVVAWYDNEMSYTNQMVRVVELVGSL